MTPKWLTIGVEEEYQIVDANGELKPHITTLMAEHGDVLGDHVRPEMIQSVVEAGTGICDTVEQAREEIVELRTNVASVLAQSGLRLACAGTHPLSKWQEQPITHPGRHKKLQDQMQDRRRAVP